VTQVGYCEVALRFIECVKSSKAVKGTEMFKSMLVLFIFAVVSISPATAVAVSADSVGTLSVENSRDNDVALLQVGDSGADRVQNPKTQPQALSANDGESVLSMEWLFAVALFWFVMLSNRRGV
jgi:hypothetical protein